MKIRVPPLPPAVPSDPVAWEKGVAILEQVPPLVSPTAMAPSKTKVARPQRPAHHARW